jgi:hypothetical protein
MAKGRRSGLLPPRCDERRQTSLSAGPTFFEPGKGREVTPELKAEFEKRLHAAECIQVRIGRMEQMLLALSGKTVNNRFVTHVGLELGKTNILAKFDGGEFGQVCWAGNEQDLARRIVQAIRMEITRELEGLKAEYHKV